ncbi:MAG: Vacuolar (H+)-ATPase G subunit [Coprococcus sp.]
MLQETMQTVCDAEAKADDIVKKAKEEADVILDNAKKKAEEITEQAHIAARSDLKKAADEQKANEKKLIDKALDDATTEIGSLKKIAADKEQAAIEMVMNELI